MNNNKKCINEKKPPNGIIFNQTYNKKENICIKKSKPSLY